MSNREKKYRKCNFDVVKAVHEAEYSHVKRPIDPATKRPLEPAHRFEVNLEGDSVSQAKYVYTSKPGVGMDGAYAVQIRPLPQVPNQNPQGRPLEMENQRLPTFPLLRPPAIPGKP